MAGEVSQNGRPVGEDDGAVPQRVELGCDHADLGCAVGREPVEQPMEGTADEGVAGADGLDDLGLADEGGGEVPRALALLEQVDPVLPVGNEQALQ